MILAEVGALFGRVIPRGKAALPGGLWGHARDAVTARARDTRGWRYCVRLHRLLALLRALSAVTLDFLTALRSLCRRHRAQGAVFLPALQLFRTPLLLLQRTLLLLYGTLLLLLSAASGRRLLRLRRTDLCRSGLRRTDLRRTDLRRCIRGGLPALLDTVLPLLLLHGAIGRRRLPLRLRGALRRCRALNWRCALGRGSALDGGGSLNRRCALGRCRPLCGRWTRRRCGTCGGRSFGRFFFLWAALCVCG